jgi:hypothetical protein
VAIVKFASLTVLLWVRWCVWCVCVCVCFWASDLERRFWCSRQPPPQVTARAPTPRALGQVIALLKKLGKQINETTFWDVFRQMDYDNSARLGPSISQPCALPSAGWYPVAIVKFDHGVWPAMHSGCCCCRCCCALEDDARRLDVRGHRAARWHLTIALALRLRRVPWSGGAAAQQGQQGGPGSTSHFHAFAAALLPATGGVCWPLGEKALGEKGVGCARLDPGLLPSLLALTLDPSCRSRPLTLAALAVCSWLPGQKQAAFAPGGTPLDDDVRAASDKNRSSD